MNIYYYLPNRPDYPGFKSKNLISNTKKNTVTNIISKTGNHWRKIFSIMAKISWGLNHSGQSTWQGYRDHLLLSCSKQNLVFENKLLKRKNDIHVITGLQHFECFDLNMSDFTKLDEDGKILIWGNIYLTPYMDYRQFPNQLIEELIINIKER